MTQVPGAVMHLIELTTLPNKDNKVFCQLKYLRMVYRKLIKVITWITVFSNSMKLRAMPCRVTQDRQVMVESSEKTWLTGEGNGKPV